MFAKCWHMPLEAVDGKLILEKSPSLGIAGWSDPTLPVRDNGINDSERRMRERQEHALRGHDRVNDEDVENHNVQIIRLIPALGSRDSGRRAILTAMAAKHCVSSDQQIDDLMSDTAQRRLQVPAYLRDVLCDIGLGDALSP